MLNEHPVLTWLGNIGAVTTIAGTILGWLPAFAALVAIGWYIIQIIESKTFNAWRERRLAFKILKTKEHIVAMELYMADLKEADRAYWLSVAGKTRTLLDELKSHQAGS